MKTREAGFTFIELVMTVLLSSIFTLVLVSFLHTMLKRGVDLRNRQEAMQLAKIKMDETNLLPDGAFTWPGPTDVTLPADPAFPGYEVRRRNQNEVTSGGRSCRRFEIRVIFPGGNINQALARLVTYRLDDASLDA